jgi:hypothetical protein
MGANGDAGMRSGLDGGPAGHRFRDLEQLLNLNPTRPNRLDDIEAAPTSFR